MTDRSGGNGRGGAADWADGLDEAAAERLMAVFGYGSGTGVSTGAASNAPTANAAGADTERHALPPDGSGRGVATTPGGSGGRHSARYLNATAGGAPDSETTPNGAPSAHQTNRPDAGGPVRPGGPAGSAEGRSTDMPDQLHRLLAAAAAPGHPHELRGYETARRAFVAAGTAGAAAEARRRGRHLASHPLTRIAGVKFAALASALAVTGVAVAAEADVLPTPLQRVAHEMLGGVGVPDPEPEGPEPNASEPPHSGLPGTPHTPQPSGATPQGHGGVTGPNGGPTSGGTLSQSTITDGNSVVEMCRAYMRYVSGGNADGNSGGDPAGLHRKLSALAGGDQYVDAYCAQVLATAPAPTTPQPSGTVPTTPSSPAKTHPTHDPHGGQTTDPNGNGGPGGANPNLTVPSPKKTHL